MSERREAERGFKEFLDGREKRKLGLPDHSGWQMPYADIVDRFLEEAPITSEARVQNLRRWLTANRLRIHVGSDLSKLGELTAKARALLKSETEDYVIRCVQLPLKQMARWAASIGLLPYDPLAAWRPLPSSAEKTPRRAFFPDEMRAILAAADELDGLFGRNFPSSIVFKTLLLTGNRPGAVFGASVGDLAGNRVVLSPGTGKKRNGMATLPPAFTPELKSYIALRGRPGSKEPLLVSHKGCSIDRLNITDDFKFSMVLAFVNMAWPTDDALAAQVEPVEVAYLLYKGVHRGFDGAPPKDAAKLTARAQRLRCIQEMANRVASAVEQRLAHRDMYTLRKTHTSWARQLVNPDSVKLQVGHAPQDVEERHYLDLVDARESSQAVWDVLNGTRFLRSEQYRKQEPMALAAGAENLGNPQPLVLNVALSEKEQTKTRPEGRALLTEVLQSTELKMVGATGHQLNFL